MPKICERRVGENMVTDVFKKGNVILNGNLPIPT